mgnify:FL=1
MLDSGGSEMKIIKLISISIVFVALCVFNHQDNAAFNSVKNGTASLVCNIKEAPRVIDASKVVGFSDGVWFFENGGHSKTCTVQHKKKGM